MREVEAIVTELNGITYRSRTEARWAVFFRSLGLSFEYERKQFKLSTGQGYLPDFWIPDFKAFFEVKGGSDAIVTEEAAKARQLAADHAGQRVWLAIGTPDPGTPNILPLEKWPHETPISEILETPENRYRFLADRRDEHVFWLQADYVEGGFRESYLLGGPGKVTEHDRLPIMTGELEAAYAAAAAARW